MKLVPVISEKSTKLVKNGGYTFLVPVNLTKTNIKELVSTIFNVHVEVVRTISSKPGIKRNMRGKIQKIKKTKKAIVFVKKGEKIALFEEEKKIKKGKNAKAKKNTK